MSDHFFTTFTNYFHCCADRGCCFATKESNIHNHESNIHNDENHVDSDYSPYSFDDYSNPISPMTNSSSSSSIDSLYKRQTYRPYVGIIPAHYYNN
jgi:hypothetical protein